MTATVGKKLQDGKYILNQELGEGGFGLTYQAFNPILDRVVVIKTFKSSSYKETELAEMRKQFLKEAQRLVQCYHPNIVRFYEFFIEDGVPYIVMDYIAGQTLHKLVIPNNPLPEAIAIKYIRQIGEALKVVHSQGLLHRDIKPQNLILRQDSQQVILIDFGIAREFNQEIIQTHTSVASDGYAPIEQYLPKAKRTPATDIYGLAATLYTLVTAQIPISATLRNRIALDPPNDIRPELSDRISQAIMKGIALEQEERPSSVEEWLNLLPQNEQNTELDSVKTVSVKTVALLTTKNQSENLSKVSQANKLIYPKQMVPGLIAFATIIWGLDYAWLRFKASAPNQKIQLNTVEPSLPKNPTVIPAEKSEPITSEEPKESIVSAGDETITPEPIKTPKPTSTAPTTPAPSPQRVTPESIKTSKPASTAPTTPAPSPRRVTPKPVKKAPPSTKVSPKRSRKNNSNQVPSVFVSPSQRIAPKTNDSSNRNRVPSIFVSPSERRRIDDDD